MVPPTSNRLRWQEEHSGVTPWASRLLADSAPSRDANAQSDSLQKENLSENNLFPRFDLHIAIGFVSGGRFGGRVQFDKHWSGEVSLGYDWRNFVSASDANERYAIALNWHKGGSSNLALSLIVCYSRNVYSAGRWILLSPNVGLLSLNELGLRFFCRGGAYVGLHRDIFSGKVKYDGVGMNLDVGLLYCLP